jgi:hypothetical protein
MSRSSRNDAAFGGWVKRIATNKALAHLRSAWHRKSGAWRPGRTGAAGLGIGRPGRPGEPGSRTRRAWSGRWNPLSPTARAVVWLYDVEGYSHQEIAALMGRTVSFSKSRLARAHEQLRAVLGPDYDEVSGMHATTEQLLSLRDGQPVDAGGRGTCRRLRALPPRAAGARAGAQAAGLAGAGSAGRPVAQRWP